MILTSGLATGGAERVTVAFVSHLVASSHSVTPIVCTMTARHDGPLGQQLERDGVRRLDLDVRRLANPTNLVKYHRLLRRERIDLIVMGTLARVGIPGLFIGNTAERTLDHVDCDILAIKPKEFVTPVQLPHQD